MCWRSSGGRLGKHGQVTPSRGANDAKYTSLKSTGVGGRRALYVPVVPAAVWPIIGVAGDGVGDEAERCGWERLIGGHFPALGVTKGVINMSITPTAHRWPCLPHHAPSALCTYPEVRYPISKPNAPRHLTHRHLALEHRRPRHRVRVEVVINLPLVSILPLFHRLINYGIDTIQSKERLPCP